MAIEIERRFLITEVPTNFMIESTLEVSDRYLPVDSDHAQLRLRRRGEKFEITKKVPKNDSDLSEMIEHTIPLSATEYAALASVPAKEVSKQRVRTLLQGSLAEFGIFTGKLEGLIILDVEFQGKSEAENFVIPEYVGAEITNDRRFAGGELCGKAFKDLENAISEYSVSP